jgi:hypothetical protein
MAKYGRRYGKRTLDMGSGGEEPHRIGKKGSETKLGRRITRITGRYRNQRSKYP